MPAQITQVEERAGSLYQVTYTETTAVKVATVFPVVLTALQGALAAAYLHPSLANATTPAEVEQAILAQASTIATTIDAALQASGLVKP